MRPRGRTGNSSAPRGLLGAACALLTVAVAAGACARPGETAGGTPSDGARSLRASAGVLRPDIRPYTPTRVAPRPGVAACAQPPGPVARPVPGRSRGAAPGHPRGSGPNDAGHPRGSGPNDAGPAPAPDAATADSAAASDAAASAAAASEAAAADVIATDATTAPDDAAERQRRVLESQHSPVPRRGDVAPAAATGAEQCIVVVRLELALRTAGSGQPPDEAGIRATLANAGLIGPVVQPGPVFAASTGEVCVLGTFTAGTPAFTIAALPADRSCRP